MKNIFATHLDIRSVYNEMGNYFKMDKRYCHAICVPFENSENVFHGESGRYKLTEGKVIYIPMGLSYELVTHKDGVVGLINFMGEMNLKDFRLQTVSSPGHVQRLFLDIENACDEYDRLLKLYTLLKYLDDDENSAMGKDLIEIQLNYINNNYSDPSISVEKLAKMTNISSVYFRKLFLRVMGVSPYKYVMQVRINEAKKLLKKNKYSVEAVSEMCGFASQYHFSYAFKKSEGIPPIQYAKNHRFI